MPYDASTLSFKIKGRKTPSCRYVLVSWRPGKGGRRELLSCHRVQKTAKAAYHKRLRKMKGAPKYLWSSHDAVGIYDLKNGKKVESWNPPKRGPSKLMKRFKL